MRDRTTARILGALSVLLACRASPAAPFAASDALAVQIALDRRGFSCNVIDGEWGRKSQVALATYCAVNALELPASPAAARVQLFADEPTLFTVRTVSQDEAAACRKIPATPEQKARLDRMGFETLQEMYAEYGHLSEGALRRLNPRLAWPNPPAGSRVTLPDFSRVVTPKGAAAVLRVCLSRFEITVFDASERLIALFPCSIAAQRSKCPPAGELYVTTLISDPDYTYTAERVAPNGRISRWIYPPGPNNPVGRAWIGLSLPGYGIHGTPFPERIGRAESHGCFRLANWNASRLRRLCGTGLSVIIEP